jgi:hypothetical protein
MDRHRHGALLSSPPALGLRLGCASCAALAWPRLLPTSVSFQSASHLDWIDPDLFSDAQHVRFMQPRALKGKR